MKHHLPHATGSWFHRLLQTGHTPRTEDGGEVTRGGFSPVPAIRCVLTRAMAAWVLGIATAHGQEALRESLAGDRAAEARKAALESRDYNLKIGRLNLNFAAGLSIEYNDNIRYSNLGKEDDIIFRPSLTTSGHLPLSEQNALSFSVGVGYLTYVENTEFNRFQVTPDTAVAFDLFVDNFRFTFYDRVSYSVDPVSNATVSNSADYGGLDNVAGLNVLWDLNKVVLTAGYGHRNWMSTTDRYEYLDRTSELFSLRAGYEASQTLVVGPEGSLSLTSYDEPILHDSIGYSVGAFAEWQASEKIRVRLRGGYVSYDFDYVDAFGDAGDASTYYYSIGASHRLNQYLTLSVDVSRDVQLSTESDFTELLTARLGMNWRIIRRVGLNTYFVYEDGTQPPFIRLYQGQILFRQQEDFDRFGFGIGTSYQFMQKLSASLSYRYYLRNSDIAVREYDQNSVTLGFAYQF